MRILSPWCIFVHTRYGGGGEASHLFLESSGLALGESLALGQPVRPPRLALGQPGPPTNTTNAIGATEYGGGARPVNHFRPGPEINHESFAARTIWGKASRTFSPWREYVNTAPAGGGRAGAASASCSNSSAIDACGGGRRHAFCTIAVRLNAMQPR